MTYSGNGKLSRFSFEEKVRLLKIGEYRSSPQGQNRAVGLTPQTQEGTPIEPASAKRAEEEAEEEDEETYVVPEGQGCFSFRQSLLLRAKDTFAARCTGNKYEVISRWLLTGLAVVLSRQNWQLLAKRGTLTATPQNLLKRYHAT